MKKVRELRECDKIDRVWTIDGRIRFIIAGDSSNTIVKLPSPYVTVENALQKKF
jgi:hypothetical protein